MRFADIFNLQGTNLLDKMSEQERNAVQSYVAEGYERDVQSRSGWEEKYAEALTLAMQVKKNKTFPWRGAANLRYPLLTMACTQFSSRAYQALIKPNQVVKPLRDSDKGWAIAKEIDYYLLKEMEYWEEEQDKLFMILALMGSVWKKTYTNDEGVQSELVLPSDFVIDYYAKSTNSARRKSHRVGYSKNDLETEFRLGRFRRPDQELQEASITMDDRPSDDVSDEIQGASKPYVDGEYNIIECHCWYDLDEDGYEEPYVVHLDVTSGQVLRVASRIKSITMAKGDMVVDGYDPELARVRFKIAKIVPQEFFTKYSFIPSMDGSVYDIGFAHLLLHLNKGVDAIMNQLIDAGTSSNVSGGLLSRNVRVRSGKIEQAPNRWVRTDASGDELAKGVFPWPIKEPSPALLALMQFLIDAGQRVGSVTDAMTGENPGQHQKATTTQAVLEQGMQVFNSVYKRIWRALSKELKKVHENLRDINPEVFSMESNDFCPVADPSVMSASMRIQRAMALMERVAQAPHIYGPQGSMMAEVRWLDAMEIDNKEALLTGDGQMPPDPKTLVLQETQRHNQVMEELESIKTMANALKDKATIESKGVDDQVKVKKVDIEEARLALDNGIKRAQLILDDSRGREELEAKSRSEAVSKDSAKKD